MTTISAKRDKVSEQRSISLRTRPIGAFVVVLLLFFAAGVTRFMTFRDAF